MSKTIYFEDIFVGQKFRSISVEATADEMIRFARDNDPQFFHVDDEAAKDSIFGGLIASGWQTGALTLRLLLTGCGVTFAGGVIGVEARISWKRPVRPGDHLHIEGEITRTAPSRSRGDRGFVTFAATTFNQDGAVVQTLEAVMVVFRNPARAEEPGQARGQA